MTTTKRWVSLYVENDIGVLAKISGLFSGKSYNLQSLTVGETEDPTVSRMTIGMLSDDITFEQILKYILPIDIADRILSIFTDVNSIYKNHYAIYILDPATSSGIYTNVKLKLQAETQLKVNIGEF